MLLIRLRSDAFPSDARPAVDVEVTQHVRFRVSKEKVARVEMRTAGNVRQRCLIGDYKQFNVLDPQNGKYSTHLRINVFHFRLGLFADAARRVRNASFVTGRRRSTASSGGATSVD